MTVVNSLWIGPELSDMEVVCINSHIQQGHEYHLWCYDQVGRVPSGVIVEEAAQILPRQNIFSYQTGFGAGSVSAFSNLFRYKLLAESRGWWVDTDVVALRPFPDHLDWVFASERAENRTDHPTTCVIKAAGWFGGACYHKAAAHDRKSLKWGVIGPHLIADMINYFDLESFVQPSSAFCPIHWFGPLACEQNTDFATSYGMHLWHEMWRRRSIDKNGVFAKDTLYERLKESYLCPRSENSGEEHRVGLRIL